MIKFVDIEVGDKVHYQPEHYKKEGKWENGIVKAIPSYTPGSIRVVYNCAGNWNDYENYTSALTNLNDLYHGWK